LHKNGRKEHLKECSQITENKAIANAPKTYLFSLVIRADREVSPLFSPVAENPLNINIAA